jgi:DNA (cytosine-5)-methyltransferase 1
MSEHKFPYKWHLTEGYPAPGIEPHKTKVFTTFSCGGGSSMGYKLAGYDVFAANDIDPQMQMIYEANHHPKYYFLSDIRSLIDKTDWPDEFKDLDVLDGSPPCSTFSTIGSREDAWGKEKVFREGQAKQTLDDLFFEFIALAKKLQPKIVISENVKGLLLGNARGYVKQIFREFDEAGYTTQAFLLNGATMGIPQMRERVFFISGRKDLQFPKLQMSFNEKPILYKEFVSGKGRALSEGSLYLKRWKLRQYGDLDFSDITKRHEGKNSGFSDHFQYLHRVPPTLTAKGDGLIRYDEPYYISKEDSLHISSFPQDYNTCGLSTNYICGMSVPPIMMAQVSNQVYEQWLKSLYNKNEEK